MEDLYEYSTPELVRLLGSRFKEYRMRCNLTQKEKAVLCHIVTVQGADFIKTSTGFGSAGATLEDVSYMRRMCGNDVKVKAAGGIRTKEDAQKMVEAGADRIGASALK